MENDFHPQSDKIAAWTKQHAISLSLIFSKDYCPNTGIADTEENFRRFATGMFA